MKYDFTAESCRVCLKKCGKLRSIYKPFEEGDDPPSEMLEQLTGYAVEEANVSIDLPKYICKSCDLSLNLAYQFRTEALKTTRIIQMYCSNLEERKETYGTVKEEFEEFQSMETEGEIILTEEVDIVGATNDEKNVPYVFSDVETVQSEENVEYLDELYLDYEVSLSAIDDGHNSQPMLDNLGDGDINKTEKELLPNLPFNALEPNSETLTKTKSKSAPTKKFEQKRGVLNKSKNKKHSNAQIKEFPETGSRLSVKINARNSETALKGRKKKDAKESKHICDICGNFFGKRSRLMDHRRRHDKQMNYACEICGKRFNLREPLRKHMYLHTGGKPFNCSYCSRTFYYESVLKAHEAVHRGYKPYVCEICNKAFSYAHALKKHSLIHADIKLFHCNYCKKDFRLPHHMKQHEETKMHQKAVLDAHRNNSRGARIMGNLNVNWEQDKEEEDNSSGRTGLNEYV